MSQEKIEAHVMGQVYTLLAPEQEVDDLRLAVTRVDEAMCKIRDAGKIKARDRIAVLAALNLVLDAQQKDKLTPIASKGESAYESGAQHTAPTEAQENDTRLATILYKLDQALGRDGHLL